jgi:hypothetical protein
MKKTPKISAEVNTTELFDFRINSEIKYPYIVISMFSVTVGKETSFIDDSSSPLYSFLKMANA